MPGPSILSHSQQIGLLQRRLNIAEEGWRYSENTLHTLIEQIKTIDDYKSVAPDLNKEIQELMIEGMRLAGMPE